MAKDAYRAIADRYSKVFGVHDKTYMAFFRKLFRQNRVNSVLDCACGTGHDLHLFYELGCEVTGSDISPSMLTQARKNFRKCKIKIPLYKLDYRTLHENFREKFNAVVCLSSSILHMPSNKDVVRAFKSMRRVLYDQGMLVLTQGTTDKQWSQKPRFILDSMDRDQARFFVIDYKKKGARYNIVDIFRCGRRFDLRVWSTEYTQMLLQDDYRKLLNQAGFKEIKFYGSFKFKPYSKKTSNKLIIVAWNT